MYSMSTQLQIRIDAKTKKDAQKIFKGMGIDMSSGIKMFLQRVVNTETIPFPIVTKNGFTESQERRILDEVGTALKARKKYSSAIKLHKDILGE